MIRHNGIEVDGRYIRHAGRILVFNIGCKRLRLIKHLILDAPQTCEQLFCRFYGDDPAGGPDMGPRIFHVNFKQIEKKLALAELKIHSTWHNSYKRYWIGPA